jgi:hypothetical protein
MVPYFIRTIATGTNLASELFDSRVQVCTSVASSVSLCALLPRAIHHSLSPPQPPLIVFPLVFLVSLVLRRTPYRLSGQLICSQVDWSCVSLCKPVIFHAVRGSNPGGGGIFFAPVQTGPGAHPASYSVGIGFFPGVKRPGRDVDHISPPSSEGKERVGLYLSPPLGLSGLF